MLHVERGDIERQGSTSPAISSSDQRTARQLLRARAAELAASIRQFEAEFGPPAIAAPAAPEA